MFVIKIHLSKVKIMLTYCMLVWGFFLKFAGVISHILILEDYSFQKLSRQAREAI